MSIRILLLTLLTFAFAIQKSQAQVQNLALNKTSVAGGYKPTTKGGAFDGNMNTYWEFRPVPGNYIYVDLGSTYTVDAVVLDVGLSGCRMTGFDIQVSPNASTWTTVYSTTTATGWRFVIDNLNSSTRYVRLNCNAGSQPNANEMRLLEFSVYAKQSTSTLATLTESTATLRNPGKGWVLYGDANATLPGQFLASHTAATKAIGGVAYVRYEWWQLQPSENTFNWSILDNAVADCQAAGIPLAIRVMAANSCSSVDYVTPKWVFDAGAQFIYTQTNCNLASIDTWQHVPVWTDPIFQQKANAFVQAVANRYDNARKLGWFEVGWYGNWGQGVLSDLGAATNLNGISDKRNVILIPHKNKFPNTQIVAEANAGKAPDLGIGIRSDVYYMTAPTGAAIGSASTAGEYYGRAMNIGEWYGSYAWMKANSTVSEAGIRERIYANRLSYMGLGQWGNDGVNFYNEHTTLINQLTNEMGYHHILQEARYPSTITSGTSFYVTTKWANKGVTFLYDKNAIAFALLNTSDGVVSKVTTADLNVMRWLPKYDNTNTTSAKEFASLTFSGVTAGTYKLAVGILSNSTDANPTYKTANTSRTANNWTVIGNITVGSGGGGTAPAAPSTLAASAISSSQINVSWKDNASNETLFRIQRKTGSGGTYADVTTVGTASGTGTTVNYSSTGLAASTNYYYRVRAENTSGVSAWSNEANATTSAGGGGTNFVKNPSFDVDNFDTQTPTNWSTWSAAGTVDADYTQTDGPHTGARNLGHWRNGSYDVYTYQTITGLTNGTYTATVWARKFGSPSSCFLQIEGYGGATLQTNITGTTYAQYTISNIQVTNGTCKIGVYTVGDNTSGCLSDDFVFTMAGQSLRMSTVRMSTDRLIPENNINSVKVYPNPVSDKLFIELPDNNNRWQYSIMTLQGSMLQRGLLILKGTQIAIDKDRINTRGVYILRLTSDKGETGVYKLIIE
jgi:hypothetical protein